MKGKVANRNAGKEAGRKVLTAKEETYDVGRKAGQGIKRKGTAAERFG